MAEDSHEMLERYGGARLNVNSRKFMEKVYKTSEATSKTDTQIKSVASPNSASQTP